MRIEPKHTCYILQDVGVHHPIAHHRHNLVWYPERGMSFLDCVDYKPYVKSIVTENPWIISCYNSNDVRIWGRNSWIYPDMQTYGASVNLIRGSLLGWSNTIPSTPLDGGVLLGRLRRRLEDERGMADATYHRKREDGECSL